MTAIDPYRSVRYLSDDQKVTLVDAAQKNKWAYLAIVIALGLFFVNVILGGIAISLYLISALTFTAEPHLVCGRMAATSILRIFAECDKFNSSN
jgi:hypothetical protein